jgi:hypothetical protein
MDLATATQQPIRLPMAGRTWKVRARSLEELGPLQAWFRETIPAPLVRAMQSLEQARKLRVDLGDSVKRMLLDHAQQETLAWPPMVLSWHWRRAVDEAGHAWKVVHYALVAEHPELTEDEARTLADTSEPGELSNVAYALRWGEPPPDPKAEGASVTTGQTSSPPLSPTTGDPSSITSGPLEVGPTERR